MKTTIVSLEQFMAEEQDRLLKFAEFWKAQHQLKPDQFPMGLPFENAGLWHEMFADFDPDRDVPPFAAKPAAVPPAAVSSKSSLRRRKA